MEWVVTGEAGKTKFYGRTSRSLVGFGLFYCLREGAVRVLKTINNNVVSCLDDQGKELVVMGKGLGFGAKPGDPLNGKLVEKVFRMDSPETITRLKDTFARLPEQLLELCSQVIDYANEVLGRRLNESIYLTLTDHIQFAIQRSERWHR